VTTDAGGRAVAAGFAPTGSGALQISASAAFQGQAAAVTIAQTNVMTAAQAAAVSSAGAGGGGGLSGTTLSIVGAAAGVGGIVAVKELASQSGTTYKRSYSGTVNTSFVPSLSFCSRTIANVGTVQIEIEVGSDGRVAGEGGVNGTTAMTSFSGPNICAITTNIQPRDVAETVGHRRRPIR